MNSLKVDLGPGGNAFKTYDSSTMPETITGGESDDQIDLSDSDGANFVDAGAGNDRVNGGYGNDEAHGGDGNDTIDGGPGNDKLFGDGGSDNLTGGDGSDELHGGDGNDGLSGQAGPDTYFGDAGDDVLYADDGSNGTQPSPDEFNGGTGNDTVDYTYWKNDINNGTVRVSLDGQANDGLTAGDGVTSVEQDNVGPSNDVENIVAPETRSETGAPSKPRWSEMTTTTRCPASGTPPRRCLAWGATTPSAAASAMTFLTGELAATS